MAPCACEWCDRPCTTTGQLSDVVPCCTPAHAGRRLELLETLAAQEVCSRGAQTDEALLSDAWLPAARRKGVPRRLPAGLVPLVKTEAGTDEEAAGAAGVPHSGCKRRRQASDAVHQAPPAAAAAGSAAAAARIELCAVDAGGALSAAPAGAAPAPKPAAPPGATVPAASQVIEELAGAGASCRSPGRQPRAAADAAAPACTASTSREEQPDATVSQQRQQKETGEGGLDGGCCTVRADAAAPQATSDGVPAQGRDAVEELPSAETKASSPAAAGAAPAAEPVAELESLGLPGAAVQATAAGTSAGGSPTVGGDGCTVEQRGDLLLSPLPGIRLEGQAASPCRIN